MIYYSTYQVAIHGWKKFPNLKTGRLFLRRLEESDWESISYLRTDKVVNQFVKRANANTREKAFDFIRKTNTGISEGKLFYWCISLKDDSEMIGSICLWNFSADKRTAELGYDLKPHFQNQGVMTEALQEVLNFGFGRLKLDKIEAFTQRRNEKSKKLLRKNQFQLNEERTDEENPENLIYEISRPAKWQKEV